MPVRKVRWEDPDVMTGAGSQRTAFRTGSGKRMFTTGGQLDKDADDNVYDCDYGHVPVSDWEKKHREKDKDKDEDKEEEKERGRSTVRKPRRGPPIVDIDVVIDSKDKNGNPTKTKVKQIRGEAHTAAYQETVESEVDEDEEEAKNREHQGCTSVPRIHLTIDVGEKSNKKSPKVPPKRRDDGGGYEPVATADDRRRRTWHYPNTPWTPAVFLPTPAYVVPAFAAAHPGDFEYRTAEAAGNRYRRYPPILRPRVHVPGFTGPPHDYYWEEERDDDRGTQRRQRR